MAQTPLGNGSAMNAASFAGVISPYGRFSRVNPITRGAELLVDLTFSSHDEFGKASRWIDPSPEAHAAHEV